MGEYGTTVTLDRGSYSVSIGPEVGLSLLSFRYRGRELLALDTGESFRRCRKGLGPLIIPHFNQAGPLPAVTPDSFPHIPHVQSLGVHHPFQHGIGRYVPWRYRAGPESLVGTMDGTMHYRGYTYAQLTGYDFTAEVTYRVREDGLQILFALEAEHPVAAGIHFYYHLPDPTNASVEASSCITGPLPFPIPCGIPVNAVFSTAACPPGHSWCSLTTDSWTLRTDFTCSGRPESSFDSLVIFHPENARFVCIEPLSSPAGEENQKKSFFGEIRLSIIDEGRQMPEL
jgi:galactose mutarotase-like enzyme